MKLFSFILCSVYFIVDPTFGDPLSTLVKALSPEVEPKNGLFEMNTLTQALQPQASHGWGHHGWGGHGGGHGHGCKEVNSRSIVQT